MRVAVILLVLISLYHSNLAAQTRINGKVYAVEDTTAVPFVSIVLYQLQSSKIVTYTQSNSDGSYTLKLSIGQGAFTLRTRRLGYEDYAQDILLDSKLPREVEVDIYLSNDTIALKEVVVNEPILIKEDTTIYDIEQFINSRDQNLEDVLSHIPGIKILANGDIEVEGKSVDKVLIDGKEISDAGAATITRSLSPEDIENVEIRFDEQDNKIKESLLDTRKYVVLDIKLKSDLNKALFGKLRFTSGVQEKVKPGGYFNGFSLLKKVNSHVWAEHDRFGEQTISLENVRNLGDEVRQELFKIPADFESLTQREDFNRQIFGFKNYTSANKNIVGLTSKYEINEHFNIYFGSFNAYDANGNGRNFTLGFNDQDLLNDFSQNNLLKQWDSRSKLELRFDQKKIKLKFDLNYLYTDRNTAEQVREAISDQDYRFNQSRFQASYFSNLLFEYAFAKKTGLQFKVSYEKRNADQRSMLRYDDLIYTAFFGNENKVAQFNEEEVFTQLYELGFITQSKVGYLNYGVRLDRKKGNASRNTDSPTREFSGVVNNLNFQNNQIFLTHRFELGSFSFNNGITWNLVDAPASSRYLFTYQAAVSYFSRSQTGIDLSYQKSVSAYPIHKLFQGLELVGWQQLYIPATTIDPVTEETIEIAYSKRFDKQQVKFEPALIFGSNQNGNRFLNGEVNLVPIAFDQLTSRYLAATLPLSKAFKKLPISMILEPEWLINEDQNITEQGEDFKVRTTRTLLGLKVNSQFEKSFFNLFLYPKYTSFRFSNSLSESLSQQEMASLDIALHFDLFDGKLLLTQQTRAVRFFGNTESEFINIGMKASTDIGKVHLFLIADNLANNRRFIQQFISPAFFTSSEAFVFERFLKIGLEYDFK